MAEHSDADERSVTRTEIQIVEDEEYDDENDDIIRIQEEDPVAEGEEPPQPKPEPSYEKASSTKFYTICLALEEVWQAGIKNKKWSDLQKLWKVLPPKYLVWLDSPTEGSNRPESIFPIFRLLMPDKDGSRQFQMAENTLAQIYGGALELAKQSQKFKMLLHFTDRNVVRTKAEGQGDFSVVVQHVIGSTKVKDKGSGFSVGDINDALDVLASFQGKARQKSNHDWKVSDEGGSAKKKKKPPSLKEMRIQWLKRLNEGTPACPGLSPLEHKWLVRILLKKLQFGLGWKKLLQWYNPYAAMLWSAHNSLKGICDKVCDPEFSKARDLLDRQRSKDGADEKVGLDSYMPKSLVAPQLGVVFSPMLSERTGFGRVLDDISRRHRDYIRSDEARLHAPNVEPDSLSFRHPAFSVEPKLDGERFLVHVRRDGVVKMHTRRGNWYSELYSPVLGPALRRAVKQGFDVILDGEIVSWDSVEGELVPFGSNRTIANLRKEWMKRNGLLDERDQGMHNNDKDTKSMNATNTWTEKSDKVSEEVGAECWLQFVAFDILYVDGPGAADFLSQTVAENITPRPSAGSIIHLDSFERKKILYKMVEPQANEVEIVQTWIIRPNGRTDLGERYFDPQTPTTECGYPAYTLDSLSCTLGGAISGLSDIDMERRHDRSDEQISEARAHALQGLYDIMVEEQRLEGLVFKDLSAPYYLGEESKSMRYWHKFKPDYFNGSVASDLDLVIIGGYFATGRRSGQPSGLLCACVDSEDSERFFPVCKVNVGSIDRAQASELWKITGLKTNDYAEDDDMGDDRWFRKDRNAKEIPEFVSRRSFQSGNENNGWRVQKKDYPDLWIHPNDSVVLTLNAGEIVATDAFSAGITLRFPRITKLRLGADGKHPSDIESEHSLWIKYQDVKSSRSISNAPSAFEIGSPVGNFAGGKCRFLTEKQYQESLKNKKRSRSSSKQPTLRVAVPDEPEAVSAVLNGLTFSLLGGTGYKLEEGSVDMEEAREQGWLDEAQRVKDSSAVIRFIKKHGGRYKLSADSGCTFVLGGSRCDPKVATFVRAIENARSQTLGKRIKTKKGQEQEKIAQSCGVLRWTYVYSLVHRWLCAGHGSEESVKATDPELMRPTVLDYLVRPSWPGSSAVVDPSLFEADLSMSNISQMRRAIGLVEESRDRRLENNREEPSQRLNWRNACIERLEADQRWVVACKHQVLWPFTRGAEPQPRTVLYPDIFDDGYGLLSEGQVTKESAEERWKHLSSDLQSTWISSALPLARVMGAFVASHLHEGVTHVLCDLTEGNNKIVFGDGTTEIIFSDTRRGRNLLDRLHALEARRLRDKIVFLVSPHWVRIRKWQGDGE